jgi:hypothetical protein
MKDTVLFSRRRFPKKVGDQDLCAPGHVREVSQPRTPLLLLVQVRNALALALGFAALPRRSGSEGVPGQASSTSASTAATSPSLR